MCIFGNRISTFFTTFFTVFHHFHHFLLLLLWREGRALGTPATSLVLQEAYDNTGDDDKSISEVRVVCAPSDEFSFVQKF